MNFASMLTALQRYGFDTTDPIETWLNASMHDLETACDWPFLEEGPTVLTTVPAGQNFIDLPSDASRIITVRDITNLYKLKYWPRRKFTALIQDQTDPGLPEVFTLIGTTQVQIWRIPYTPIAFEVVYEGLTPDLVNPTDVPSNGTVPWPVATHYPIVVHAAEIALMAENEEDRAQTAQKSYEAMLLRLMAKFNVRQLDEVEAVEDVQGYGADMGPIRGIASWGN